MSTTGMKSKPQPGLVSAAPGAAVARGSEASAESDALEGAPPTDASQMKECLNNQISLCHEESDGIRRTHRICRDEWVW